jgi:folylpolyglutamate synthase/dihydropteroate synthase
VLGKVSVNADALARTTASLTECPIRAAHAIDEAIIVAGEVAGEFGSTIVTGSLYLCGQARSIWYRDQAILEQQTQWPGT